MAMSMTVHKTIVQPRCVAIVIVIILLPLIVQKCQLEPTRSLAPIQRWLDTTLLQVHQRLLVHRILEFVV